MKVLKKFAEITMKNVMVAMNWLGHSPGITFLFIFTLTFAIRLEALMDIPSRYMVPTTRWELSSIAISLLETGQYADAYMIPTGPTAHLPPAYPYLFSLIYQIFGLTATAGYVSMSFMFLTASILFGMLPWFAKKLGMSSQAGIIGGFAGALLVEWGGHGEFPSAIVMGLLLVAFFGRWSNGKYSKSSSFLLGLAIGVSFHLQPALLPVIIGCMLFELWWSKNQNKWKFSALMTLGILIACIPWGWRNYRTFDSIFFIRSNFGLELRMGNHEGAQPAMEVMDQNEEEHRHPAAHFSDARKLKEIGEIAYMNEALDDALEWISSNPGEFLRLTGLRILHIWFGPLHDPKAASQTSALTLLALLGLIFAWKKFSIPQRGIILIPLATFPLVYYIVAYMPRYRIPIDWILLMLAGSAIWHWIGNRSIEIIDSSNE
jgi:hypothetical protein